jgi:uncharacterized membrane protein
MKSTIGLVTMTLVISAWVGAGLFYHELPNLMPTHWSIPFDRANGFTPKPWGPFVMPLLMAIMWLGTPVFRTLSPRKQKVERFPGAFEFRMMLSIALLSGPVMVITGLGLLALVAFVR